MSSHFFAQSCTLLNAKIKQTKTEINNRQAKYKRIALKKDLRTRSFRKSSASRGKKNPRIYS